MKSVKSTKACVIRALLIGQIGLAQNHFLRGQIFGLAEIFRLLKDILGITELT